MPHLIHRGARFLARRTFSFWEKLGLHLTYVHFYEPVPDTRNLNDALWNRTSELPGIDMTGAFQVELLHQLSALYHKPWEGLTRNAASGGQFFLGNGYFDSVDAEILYGIVRRFKPRRVWEIGSGFSTLLVTQAIRNNQEQDCSYACKCVAIDPFPPRFLRKDGNGFSVLPTKVREIPVRTFAKLERHDVLFFDSSHVLAIGSDVRYEYLDIVTTFS